MLKDYVLFKSDLLAQLERYEEALSTLQDLMAFTDKREEVYLHMGNVAQVCGQAEDSESFYQMALSINPEFKEAVYELGISL